MDIAIVGGGASGLMAALSAAERGYCVRLLERQSRVGRKLLATGNGRCNLSNLHLSLQNYHGNEPTFAAYYAKKRAEGKEHRVALTHVAKKLLRVVYALQTKELPYNPDFIR